MHLFSFSQFLNNDRQSTVENYIAHCAEGEKFYLNEGATVAGNYLILVGPEGDFSEKEIQQCLDARYRPISLGNSRLRTETAALTSCLEISIINR